ncbi:MAG: sigma-54-dependent Fis family transcriptional regulator [Fibrobacteres bacterium]|nr:sigma-54-dependent Fis family transcriptional regulator [Fibrobacterota bacterium]
MIPTSQIIHASGLYITLNNALVITSAEPINEALGWSIANYYCQILKGRAVKEFFEMSDRPDTSDTIAIYQSRNRYEQFERFFEFYTSLPLSRLSFIRKTDKGAEGLIQMSPLGNAMSPYRPYPAFLCDGTGIIKACNRAFLNATATYVSVKYELFQKNIGTLLTPSPLETTLAQPELPDVFNMLYAKPLPLLQNLPLTWVSSESKEHLLKLAGPIDGEKLDYCFHMEIEVESGSPPSVILNGVDDFDNFFPDLMGYLLGPDPHSNGVQLKKEGVAIHRAAAEMTVAGRVVIDVVKRGCIMSLFVNSRPLISYRDTKPIVSSDGYIYLYQRLPGRIRLLSAQLSALPSDKSEQSGFNETRIQTTDSACFFQPFHHNSLFKPALQLYGFMLQDVTSLKRAVAQLELSNKNIKRERDRYKAMARGTEKRDTVFIGESGAMVRLRRESRQAAATDITVLLEGETGTGKEVLARYIHEQSERSKGPFIHVDCSAIPETLLESELFGVDKGAFTGAVESRPGKFEQADRGTLFLDELASLTLQVQAKLLTVLQDFRITRLGGRSSTKVDCRLITATNRPLKSLVDQGLFRADLYYRLNAARFNLPPLRERLEDLPLLCTHFLQRSNNRFNRSVKGFEPEAFRRLALHSWPGNIRELEHFIQKAVVFSTGETLGTADVELPVSVSPEPASATATALPKGDSRALTRTAVLEYLQRNHNIVARAVADSGVSRATFFRKMKQFGIKIRSA